MDKIKTEWAEVDEQGRLVLDAALVETYGLQPGARLRIDRDANTIRLHRPVTQLAKLYVEPTNWCNIDCRTCMRNNWQTETGFMSRETFDRIVEGLEQVTPRPTVIFSGIGEPLSHGRIAEMVRCVHDLGCRTEMITNGTLLSEKRGRSLIDAGLDLLWVSIDGVRPESYGDIRLGAELPRVLENLWRFVRMRTLAYRPVPEIGIAFVAMKRNIGDLPELLELGRRMRVMYFHVSNLLPHTEDMAREILYTKALSNVTYAESPWTRKLMIPKMDLNEHTGEVFVKALDSGYNVNLAGSNMSASNDVCTFIENGATVVGWKGELSPCPPLLHTHVGYLQGKERLSLKHVIGNIHDRDLLDLWYDPEYMEYRERVQSFAFAPCSFCGGCEMSLDNETDCFDNPAPACGGCLWAQGVIQCP